MLEKWLRVPWTARRSNQSILKEISPEYSLEGLMLKLKLQYFGHSMRRADSLEKTLVLGKIEGRRRRGWQRGWDGWMASLTQWTRVGASFGSQWWTGKPGMVQSMRSQRIGHDWVTELNYNIKNDLLARWDYGLYQAYSNFSVFCKLYINTINLKKCLHKENFIFGDIGNIWSSLWSFKLFILFTRLLLPVRI